MLAGYFIGCKKNKGNFSSTGSENKHENQELVGVQKFVFQGTGIRGRVIYKRKNKLRTKFIRWVRHTDPLATPVTG